MVRKQILLDKNLDHELTTTAKIENQSVSELIRLGMNEYLVRHKRKQRRGNPAFLMRLADNAKSFGKGNKRLSENIDKVLYG
jgi:hypothetical protein|tara:strand:+ start:156 stop:401 length:246 start_codon:yes stop_codon:yes gene_type:complete